MTGSDPEQECRRLRAELESLRESERMYRASAELAGRLVWSNDGTATMTAVSHLFASRQEPGEDQVDHYRLWDSVHPDDRDKIRAAWHHCLASGEPLEIEFRTVMKDGSIRIVRSRARPSRDESGRIVRWYGASEDVTDERAAEESRREVEERYRLAVLATNDAVWDYDLVAGTIEWSDTSSALLGFGERLGKTQWTWWRDRIHPEDRRRIASSFGQALRGRRTHWTATYRFLRGDGLYADVLDRGFIIRNPEGRAIRAVGALGDLTERKAAEAEIRRMQADLIHVSRLSAMGAMASTLAHEINQPLAAISNYLSAAGRIAITTRADPELENAIRSAASGARRAGEIVRRLRELVARSKVVMRCEHLPRLIEEAGIVAFVDQVQVGFDYRLELDPDALWIMGDRIQIEQVLINLIRNAVDAVADSPTREILISSRRTSDTLVEIAVSDTGPGIAPDLFDSIFSRFTSTKSGGIGIGLAISRTIVELHGGQISAENKEEGGAIFRFTVPLAPAENKTSGDWFP